MAGSEPSCPHVFPQESLSEFEEQHNIYRQEFPSVGREVGWRVFIPILSQIITKCIGCLLRNIQAPVLGPSSLCRVGLGRRRSMLEDGSGWMGGAVKFPELCFYQMGSKHTSPQGRVAM